eukprot:TRINITY_DN2122_c0_g1_i15.p1 TRINITY_DN2122_c0_g1~~TRINITY_DN2122_c0_g1_i15.p1  ORF type:complete len:112 (-),score=4.09 TRINITY_DN2122_c0_g1_i15:393-689(-)
MKHASNIHAALPTPQQPRFGQEVGGASGSTAVLWNGSRSIGRCTWCLSVPCVIVRHGSGGHTGDQKHTISCVTSGGRAARYFCSKQHAATRMRRHDVQ